MNPNNNNFSFNGKHLDYWSIKLKWSFK